MTSSGGSIGKERMEDEEEGEKESLPLGHGRLLRSRGHRKDFMDEKKDCREKDEIDTIKSKKKTRKSDVLEEMENDEMNNTQNIDFGDGEQPVG